MHICKLTGLEGCIIRDNISKGKTLQRFVEIFSKSPTYFYSKI